MADFKILPSDGTHMSGLVTDEANQLPRQCSNCVFYKEDHCNHPVVMYDPDVLGTQGEPKPVGDKWCCNFFRSPKRVLLYAMRHGEDENDKLIGGWEDAPIDEKGIKDAKEAAEILKDKGIRCIVSSDMKRTMETVKIVAKEMGIRPKDILTDVRLRTWNKGYLNGEEKTDENKEVLGYFKDHPTLVIPDGEAHKGFETRSDEAFDYYLECARETGTKLLSLHNSGIKQLQRYVQHKSDPEAGLTSKNESPDSVEPGGILEVSEDHGVLSCKVIFKDANHKFQN
jgi:broad specificity phosphatase PhoE